MELKYCFNGVDYTYILDDEYAKYDILKPEIKKLELDWNTYDLIELFDNMCLWDHIFNEDTIEWLKDKYKWEAREKFEEENHVETEEDYELSLEERG